MEVFGEGDIVQCFVVIFVVEDGVFVVKFQFDRWVLYIDRIGDVFIEEDVVFVFEFF